MTEQEPLRCPWHDEVLLIMLTGLGSTIAHCPMPVCCVNVVEDDFDAIVRRLSSMKLLDRLVREAVDAERAACAKLAGESETGSKAADYIRARETKGKV